ncbi:D-glycero-beta-D-manno-heptose 1-phosphate adenylyltransferase [Catellatospora sp. NPDC049609]|uniref:D-glycero-beta-D-manno-heptose 1-phosphate adenylyltransferase n=1 Tax=Catellatospora sp. NPDC049609 TaxID=3155505 RepID=UPI003437BEAE
MAFEGALSRDGADDRAPAEPATLALPPQARPPAAESLRHPVLTTRPAAPRGRSRAHADRIVVIGDTLLDRDTTGQVNRLSPEAPIPVVEAMSTVSRPGGAGLTALLAAHYGKQVVLITALADDDPADDLRRMLRDAGVELIDHGLTGTTPVKSRIRAAGRSLLMLDGAPPPGRIVRELSTEGAAAIAASGSVIVSDYGRGITSVASVRSALAEAASRVPLVWDPHPKGAAPVPGVRVVTPNAREAAHFTGTPQGGDLNAQTQQARELVRRWSAASIAVTLGDRGAMLVEDQDLPALVVPVPERAAGARPADSCGAGDVFAARTAVQLADGALLSEAIIGSVWAASAYVTAGGPAGLAAATPVREAADGRSVDALELAARVRAAGGTVVATGGCFDLLHRGHISLLEQARQLGDCLIVCLNSDESVSRLKGQSRPVVTMPDRALVLSALQSVDAVVVFEEDTPLRLLERLRPHIFVKGGDYSNMVIPEAKAVRAWGGEVVTVPYLAGRSTSSLITRAVRGANA